MCSIVVDARRRFDGADDASWPQPDPSRRASAPLAFRSPPALGLRRRVVGGVALDVVVPFRGNHVLGRDGVDVSDLWTHFRLIRIYDALHTADARRDAAEHLGAIQRQLVQRSTSAGRAQ